ncbi:MAG: PAS domain S-box protein [Pseudomonadota bacterium]|nr:PAS domain S-box protein [Pseudomonadota bacterium]MDQ2705069.1 PAS domain S-box protein [Pseudomonadota bacterium]
MTKVKHFNPNADPLANARLAAIVDSSFDAIIGKDLDSIITDWNQTAEQLFGYTADEIIGQSIRILIPDGLQHEEADIINRIRRGERVASYETTRRRKDGTFVAASLTVSPIKDQEGNIVGASQIARDITAVKENERRIRLLMREVNHRVKNQFAVILSVVRETSRRADDPREFEEQIRDRIMALSRSHDLLVTSEWSGASLLDLLQEHLKPFGHDEQISLAGPLVTLQPNAVQHLGMAFHELGTNSSKFGALASDIGSVAINWQIVTAEEGNREFQVVWEEKSSTPEQDTASDGQRKGFGSVVLQRVTPQSLSGTALLERSPGYVRWSLTAPVESTLVLPLNEHGEVPERAEMPA